MPTHANAVVECCDETFVLGVFLDSGSRLTETYLHRHTSALMPSSTVVFLLNDSSTALFPVASMTCLRSPGSTAVRMLNAYFSKRSAESLTGVEEAYFAYQLVKLKVKVLLCEYLQLACLARGVCERLRIPIVGHSHGYDLTAQLRKPGWELHYRRVLPQLAAVVVVADRFRCVLEQLGVPSCNIHVISCGTDVEETALDRRYGPEDVYSIVMVGRLIGKKGPIFALDSFRRVLSVRDDVHLTIVGDGPLYDGVLQYIESCGIQDKVSVVGAQTHAVVKSILAKAHVFIQHSLRSSDGDEEGLPVSILEAMACGVPVVSTIHSGIPETIRHGWSGLLVKPSDSLGMANGIIELVSNVALRKKLAGNASNELRARFDVKVKLAELRELLQTIVKTSD